MSPPQEEKEKEKEKAQAHWLDRYANNFHTWSSSTNQHGQTTFHRPLGLVELSFDTDGVYYGGRADMTATLTLQLATSLSATDTRRRIALAWTLLRLRHVLLLSRTFDDPVTGLRCFAVDIPTSSSKAISECEKGIVWLEDHYASINTVDFHEHALNTARVIDPATCLSKLHVLPFVRLPDGTYELQFLIVMAHQISDGRSAYTWFSELVRLLNAPARILETDLHSALEPDRVSQTLPAAQEDLYPGVSGTRARRRWIWAILRVLRHVHRPLPQTFANPLCRPRRRSAPLPLEHTYAKVFRYDDALRPPLSTGHIAATLSRRASARLISLCRAASLSIGAGCFALAGLAMMDLYARGSPSAARAVLNSGDQMPAMTASFPLDPRGFFPRPPAPDSCMLAFSSGIVMPFLPASLPIEARFRLAARGANRELRAYQKRVRPTSNGGMDRHSPARLLRMGYLAQIERVFDKAPEERKGLLGLGLEMRGSPQGALAASPGLVATCGVSSVGDLKGFFRPGEFDVSIKDKEKERDFVVDYRGLRMGVRAREGEFLIGSSTSAEGRVGFAVSYDMCGIDREAAELWARTITGLLEKSDGAKL